MDHGVCYVILTSTQFNRTTAFAFLEALQHEFYSTYSEKIHTVSRPYAFIDFGRYFYFIILCLDYEIQKLHKLYTDTRSSNMNQLNVALQDVQRIMVKNIDDVLQRGEALSSRFDGVFEFNIDANVDTISLFIDLSFNLIYSHFIFFKLSKISFYTLQLF